MTPDEYIVIEPSIVGSSSSGFETIYGWDGRRYPSADEAIAAGFKSRESDDFNIGVVVGNSLIDFRWMHRPMDDREGMRAIAKQHGFKLREAA